MNTLTALTISTVVICYIMYAIALGYVASQVNAYIEEKTHFVIAIPIAFTIIFAGIFAPPMLASIIFP